MKNKSHDIINTAVRTEVGVVEASSCHNNTCIFGDLHNVDHCTHFISNFIHRIVGKKVKQNNTKMDNNKK